MQLELVFKARPQTSDYNKKKVTYVISFLKGTVLQWFEPYLLEGNLDNPPIFRTLLHTNLDWYLDMAESVQVSGKGLFKRHVPDLSK